MAFKFNPFTGNLDDVGAGAAAFEVLGTVATVGDLPGGATQGDVYLVEADDNFYVWDVSAWSSLGTLAGPQGPTGATGPAGADGADGADGIGVDAGGTTGQVLAKASNTDYDTEWVDQTGGGGTPGGSDTQVQFNDGGSFAGDSGLTYDDAAGALTVGGKTVTTDAPIINLSQTWNNAATTFTGLKLNVTNTASAAASNLLDLQVGGTSSFSVSQNGSISGATLKINGIGANDPGGIGIGTSQSNVLAGYIGSGSVAWVSSVFGIGFILPSDAGPIGFSSAGRTSVSSVASSKDTLLYRDAAGILAQRNGTNAQTFRLYNTYTDASNFERTSLTRDSSGLVIDAQKGGTGADPTNLLDLKQANTSFFKVVAGDGSGTVTLQRANTPTLNLFQSTGAFGRFDSTQISFSAAGGTGTVSLARDSAGVIKVTDGSTGDGTISGQLRAVGTAPATASATGTAGDIRYDADYIYVCTATDTWKRAALATW